MHRDEERLVERLWINFSRGKTVTNSVCSDFFFTVIRADRKISHLSAFEVLDTVVNCDLPSGHHLPLPRRRLPLPEVEIVEDGAHEITIESPKVPDPA